MTLLAAVAPRVAGARVSVAVEPASLALTVSLDGAPWLRAEEIVVGSSTLSEGLLTLDSMTASNGTDALGAYRKTTMRCVTQLGDAVELSALDYDDDYVVFEQAFPGGLKVEATELSALTAFPAFAKDAEKRFFSYHGVFPQATSGTLDEYAESSQGGLPVVVFDAAAGSALVFSSLDHHKAQHAASGPTWFGAGIKATAAAIPAGWSQRWICAGLAGRAVRDAVDAWGAAVLKYHGVSNELRANRYRDVVHSTIGFWTDNGGYYHYATGDDPNRTYEDVLPEVHASHLEAGVPFGHWQFDSWFYPKDGSVEGGGGGGAVTNWTASDSVFPSGMAAINRALDGMPMVMHNRQWSVESDYIKNGQPPGLEWLLSGEAPDGAAAPRDPDAFFVWFFEQQDGWGLHMYEQDWMSKEYDVVEALHSNITLADDYLRAMARGVALSNRTQQYCMPYAYDILAAAALPAVTNARASNDYAHDKSQTVANWRIGLTALFYSALGVLPFKDGFYSSSLKQPGGQNEGPEPSPDRHAILATLSASMVGPMDGQGFLNASRVMATCRTDGIVLKPDRPLRAAEACFATAAPENCTFYDAATDAIDGLASIAYLYLDREPRVVPALADQLLYNWYTGALATRDAPVVVDPGYENHSYAISTPVLAGASSWAFVGEPDKYCTASSFRFSAVRPLDGDALLVTARGVADETISICAAHAEDDASWALYCAETTFAETDVPVDVTIAATAPLLRRGAVPRLASERGSTARQV
eukprot:CAMPEP_0185701764 /NCGR_PEP_ID=MMETSP1164-20130828/10199_1 /TAXON_ID=1104430 /ORGANISM="Chrysoreinhardia sp, Strain CCMP2950" /LENGTH=757 /DNA_ID=CAMNT_0028368873 /DNA_START=22 /DNA_END=2295 /DNA_ORIENTATION=-